MADTPAHIADRLDQDGQRSFDFFCSLTSTQWDFPIYDGETVWTVQQILAHFVSAEAASGLVVRSILNGGHGAPLEFDIDAFNLAEVNRLMNISSQELLGEFQHYRRTIVVLVRQMTDQDLGRIGHHPYFGETTLADILKLIYRHNQIHIRDIRRCLHL